jgi:PAS domain S-box-containing protein
MIKCLIVDDMEENRYMLEALLRGNGYEIMTACNGAEALEMARANPPDIIISDLLMPVMDGFTLCKEWKKDEHLKDIPFVVFTATYTEPEDEEFALSCGADRFIIKPQNPEKLINVLKEVLEARYPVKPAATNPLGEEMEFFRQYNEILFKKLEKKILDLELANQKLRISEDELRLHSEILAHMVESVHLVRADDGVIVYTNRRFDSVFGYDPGELVGKHVSIINAPGEKSSEAVADEIISSLKQAGVWSGEVQNIRKDGHSFWCYANVSTFKHPQYGKVWISVNWDITARKRAEDALRTSENKYRYLVENINYIIFSLNKEGLFTYISPVIEHVLGYSPVALIGHPFSELIYPEDLPLVIKAFKDVQSDILKYNEYRIFDKSSKIRWIRSSSRPNYINGNANGITGIAMDITEQKLAENALKKRENLLQKIFDVLPVGLWFADKDGKLLRGNSAGLKIWGIEPDIDPAEYGVFKARRLPSEEEIAPEDWALAHTVRSMVTFVDEMLEIDAFDGKKKIILNYTAPVQDDHGAIQGAIMVNLDITSHKLVEEELRASQQQLRALAKRVQQIREESRIIIARKIHDELGGGLTGLKIELSRLLRKNGDADRGEKRVALMDGIHRSNVLIDQMIQVVRSVATELRPSVLDDLGLIAALEGHLQEFTKQTDIPHEFVTAVENVTMEEATATAVFRIFQETLTNVARHSGATKIVVLLREEDGILFLEIRDNGRGITKAEIQDPKSLGILGMRERALVFGGTLCVSGAHYGGTAVILKIPHKQGEPS